jgi:hypothetical protein
MKVIHLIPSAFNYFNDIRDKAMSLVNRERECGIDAEAFTLQYGTVSRREVIAVAAAAPDLNFKGTVSGPALVKELDNYDVVHLHCPFFGLAKDFIVWKKLHPDKVLVLTYWRDARISDLFSLFLAWYNAFYLPKLFVLCDAVLGLFDNDFDRLKGSKYLRDKTKFADMKMYYDDLAKNNIHLTPATDELKLKHSDMEAVACVSFYSLLIQNKYGERTKEKIV